METIIQQIREFDSKKQKKSLEALQTLHFFD